MLRKIALSVAACLLPAVQPAVAGIAVINGGGTGGLISQGSNNSIITTVTSAASTVDVPIGSFVFVGATVRATGFYQSCTDSVGNTGTVTLGKAAPSAQSISILPIITTIDEPIGTTWTCTNVGNTQSKGIQVAAFSGVSSAAPDTSATATNGTGTVQAAGPTGTLSCPGGGANCEVVIAAWTNHNTGAQSAQTAGFTNFGCITNGSSFGNICMAFQIVSATTAISYTSTNANSDTWAMRLDAFSASTGVAIPHLLGGLGVGK